MSEEPLTDAAPDKPPVSSPDEKVEFLVPSMKVTVTRNDRSSIIIAAGPVTMSGKQLLPVVEISEAELDVVRTATWVRVGFRGESVMTATDASVLLGAAGPGLAVIAGAPGFGKRTAGVRALWEAAQAEKSDDGTAPALREIRPDWSDPATPDLRLLPEEPGVGYLLDVASEISAWKDPHKVAVGLVGHAETLRRKGSFLVVVADERGWPEDASGAMGRVVVHAALRPSAHRVAVAHLRHVHQKPDRVHWLDSGADGTGRVGEASMLLTENSTPAEAVRLAGKLAGVEASTEGLEAARASFQEWRGQVSDVFARTEDNADDRALLIASVFLSGEEAMAIQEAGRSLLNERPKKDVREILTGPDLATRLADVGAQVEGRHATLDHRPGYARAVLLHLWRQRADIHPHLLDWISRLTAPGQLGAARLVSISDLLVDLAIAENDIRVIDKIRAWLDNGTSRDGHLELIAGIFARTAQADALGPTIRARLLDWAKDDEVAVARTVALVCQSSFADDYPRQSLVRLRHILDRPERDEAVTTAEAALQSIAGRERQLARVWSTVIKWAKETGHLAGHRAFLALIDPRTDPFVLQVMLAAAEGKPEVRQALIDAWSTVLADSRVHGEASQVLIAWAHARATDDLIPAELLTDILRRVVARHLMTTPVSALVYGEPDVRYDQAVIDLRKDLHLPSSDMFDIGSTLEP
ncbi:hypothetical protein [Streptomyces sp. NPDC047974]|uniref:hypothetical protein n=1 Tax=Streptomyces sp. NPDC047974 TaxID=3154343 RepID=UPI0033DDA2EA